MWRRNCELIEAPDTKGGTVTFNPIQEEIAESTDDGEPDSFTTDPLDITE